MQIRSDHYCFVQYQLSVDILSLLFSLDCLSRFLLLAINNVYYSYVFFLSFVVARASGFLHNGVFFDAMKTPKQKPSREILQFSYHLCKVMCRGMRVKRAKISRI